MPVLSTSQLSLSYGNSQIFFNVNVSIADKARIGLVGPNGAGKSSLIKVIVGDTDQASGELHISEGVRIGYVPQKSCREDVCQFWADNYIPEAWEWSKKLPRSVLLQSD